MLIIIHELLFVTQHSAVESEGNMKYLFET